MGSGVSNSGFLLREEITRVLDSWMETTARFGGSTTLKVEREIKHACGGGWVSRLEEREARSETL